MDTREALEGFDSFVEQHMAEWQVPGVAIAVIKNGGVLLSKGYGYANIDSRKSVSDETIFAIASNTKAFTSMGAGILVDEGKLDWDIPVKNYIPWFEMYDPVATERITVRDMLCHRSGLPNHEFEFYNSNLSLEEHIRNFKYLEPSMDFRTGWQYQNQLLAAAGFVISRLSGKTWEDFIRERICDPLGMTRTTFRAIDVAAFENHAVPYALVNGKVKPVEFNSLDGIAPAGSINSCIRDMIRWVQLHLEKGRYGGHRIIAEKTLQEIHTPQMIDPSYPWNFPENPLHAYGLAWYVQVFRGKKILMHTGNIDGFSAVTSFMPEENVGMVILTNMTESYLDVVLQYEIYDRLCGFERKNWSVAIKKQEEINRRKLARRLTNERSVLKDSRAPGRPAEEYAGVYEHPAYGKICVYISDGALHIAINKFNSVLKPWGIDYFIWNAEESWPAASYATFLTGFFAGQDGNIAELQWYADPNPMVKPVVFGKTADSDQNRRTIK